MAKLKYLAVLVAFLPVLVYSLSEDELKDIREKCAKEHNVDLSIFKDGKIEGDMKIFEQENVMCFSKCVNVKAGLCNENDEPNVKEIATNFEIDESIVEKASAKCVKENNQEKKCLKNIKRQICMMEIIDKNKKE